MKELQYIIRKVILEQAYKGDVYPVSIIKDRYNGTYSEGKWLAFYCDVENIPHKVGGSDGDEMEFFRGNEHKDWIIGKGDNPDEAYKDLVNKVIDCYK